MQTGIVLEKTAARPFAVSLANAQPPGLPEDIRRDDVAALREEWRAVVSKCHSDIKAIKAEIKTILAQAQEAGFDTKGW